MTFFNNLAFIWDISKNKKISLDDSEEIYPLDALVHCEISSLDNSEMTIKCYNTKYTKLKNEEDIYKLVQQISKEYPKIKSFNVENPKNLNKPFMFIKNNNQILPVKQDKKNLTINDIKKTSKNNQEQNIIHASELKNKIENNESKEFDQIRKREVDEYIKGNLSNFIMDNEIKLTLNGEPEKIKTIDPLLSEDQMKSFITDKLDSVKYEYDEKENNSKFGQFTYKPSMGFMLMVQNVISSEEPKTVGDMVSTLRNKLTQISKKFGKKEAKELDNQLTKKFGEDYYKKMPLIYKQFIEQWVSGKGIIPVKGSGDYYYAMTSYFPEIISPFVPLYSSINPDCIVDNKPIDLLKSKILGSGKNPDAILRKEAFISYPLGTSNPLYDSVLMFKSGRNKHQCILLSTKGGMSGEGASASAGGLKSFIYNSQSAIPEKIFTDCKNVHFDASLYTESYLPYMIDFANQSPYNKFALKVLSAFILSSSDNYQEIVDSVYDVIYKKGKRISRNTSDIIKAKMVEKFLNGDEAVQKCVLAALTYGSYGFAQINSKQFKNGDNGDFYYKYNIQYPAIFSGHIDFSFIKSKDDKGNPIYKKLQFHIMGDKIRID